MPKVHFQGNDCPAKHVLLTKGGILKTENFTVYGRKVHLHYIYIYAKRTQVPGFTTSSQ